MSKIELPNIANPSNVSLMNNNFKKIEDALNEEVLYRKNYVGEPNEMQTNLDMNGKKIINITTGDSPNDLATRGYVDQEIDNTVEYIDQEIAEEHAFVTQQLSLTNAEVNAKYDKSGGPISGDIQMQGNNITGLPDATQFSEPATYNQLLAVESAEDSLVRIAIKEFSGTLTETPVWVDVPSHSDEDLGDALNAQSLALVSRSGLLKANADRTFVVSGDAGVKYMAHRGLSSIAPENTLPAFEAAGIAGFWGAECDIQLTSDGVWVVIHDDTVDRTTDGTGTVSSKTLAQIKALDAGSEFHPYYAGTRIPTLTEFLRVCRKYRMTPMIEFKQAGATDAQIKSAIDTCIAMIPDLQFCFLGNGEAAVQQIRNVNPNVSVELLAGAYSVAAVDACVRTGCNWLAMQYVTPFPDVSYARTKGINLTVWTVDDPDFVKICIANGVRKITTNFTNLF